MFDTIVQILCQIKEGSPSLRERLTLETDLNDDVGLDSLQMINFMVKVEEELRIEIDYDEFDYSHLRSIGTFIDFLNRCAPAAGTYEHAVE
ncbi:acyl carrier protein [Paenibacillus ehimensis]|uniref:Acyl carrier protein n=1 Tax=Paenibacillus ehimensis TaxID=79264 RepID=A0ABT8VL83_9BACL|nr:acyl carrier protein [Paenibacillus ehimensis]MDO3681710.1 acyl carrier protein [Paenibacillus ehimensis]MEC0211549.1 acyl carrier protein [Paenibacillus ehimensis]